MTTMSAAAISAWALSIVLGSLIAEDAATVSAATFAASGMLPVPVAYGAALAGIWIGDCALYAVARTFGETLLEKRWARRWLHADSVGRFGNWFRRRGSLAVMLSRLFPGTRLPISLTAGLAKMPACRFATAALLGAAAWVIAAFYLIRTVGTRFGRWTASFSTLGITLAAATLVLPRLVPIVTALTRSALRRLTRWEFWPAWLFYLPVPVMCAWLAARYRGIALPAQANPAQKNGGIVGESKIDVLRELMRAAPGQVADAYLIPSDNFRVRVTQLNKLLLEHHIRFPFVIKPDVAQRGQGFRKVSDLRQAHDYLHKVSAPVIIQRYALGPREIGVFYYRFPGEPSGHILAITDKHFPVIVGDGVHTLEELVRSDERAVMLAETYLRRFDSARDVVLPVGTQVRLVEAGNHCQGCVFRDGAYLYSEELLSHIDAISKGLPGFYIGRFDIRFGGNEDLRAGRFTIVELNGAASEATSIYDARNSLWSAYRMLFRQWRLVYAIGAANRARGHRGSGLWTILCDWRLHRRIAATYPAAD